MKDNCHLDCKVTRVNFQHRYAQFFKTFPYIWRVAAPYWCWICINFITQTQVQVTVACMHPAKVCWIIFKSYVFGGSNYPCPYMGQIQALQEQCKSWSNTESKIHQILLCKLLFLPSERHCTVSLIGHDSYLFWGCHIATGTEAWEPYQSIMHNKDYEFEEVQYFKFKQNPFMPFFFKHSIRTKWESGCGIILTLTWIK